MGIGCVEFSGRSFGKVVGWGGVEIFLKKYFFLYAVIKISTNLAASF